MKEDDSPNAGSLVHHLRTVKIIKLIDNGLIEMLLIVLNILKKIYGWSEVEDIIGPIFEIKDEDKSIAIIHLLHENKLLTERSVYNGLKKLLSDILAKKIFKQYPEIFSQDLIYRFIESCEASNSSIFIMSTITKSIEKILRGLPHGHSRCILKNYYKYKRSLDPNWKFSNKTISYLIKHTYPNNVIKYVFDRSSSYSNYESSED